MERILLFLAAVAAVAGCGGGDVTPPDAARDMSSDMAPTDARLDDAGAIDAPATDAPAVDATDVDAPSPDGATCTTDADGDGHRDIACGADDCDDTSGVTGVSRWGGVYITGGSLNSGTYEPDVTHAVQVDAYPFDYAVGCAIRTNGALVCWGRDDYGQLGDGRMAVGPFGATMVSGS